MAHFYGTVRGNRGFALRCGSKRSGYVATAYSHDGRLDTYLWHHAESGHDLARVEFVPSHGEARVLVEINLTTGETIKPT